MSKGSVLVLVALILGSQDVVFGLFGNEQEEGLIIRERAASLEPVEARVRERQFQIIEEVFSSSADDSACSDNRRAVLRARAEKRDVEGELAQRVAILPDQSHEHRNLENAGKSGAGDEVDAGADQLGLTFLVNGVLLAEEQALNVHISRSEALPLLQRALQRANSQNHAERNEQHGTELDDRNAEPRLGDVLQVF